MPATIETPSPTGKNIVDSFDARTATADEVEASLQRVGGCIIRNFMSVAACDSVYADVGGYLDADSPWEGEFFPKETRSTQLVSHCSRSVLTATRSIGPTWKIKGLHGEARRRSILPGDLQQVFDHDNYNLDGAETGDKCLTTSIEFDTRRLYWSRC